jgi:hypothetical protein
MGRGVGGCSMKKKTKARISRVIAAGRQNRTVRLLSDHDIEALNLMLGLMRELHADMQDLKRYLYPWRPPGPGR